MKCGSPVMDRLTRTCPPAPPARIRVNIVRFSDTEQPFLPAWGHGSRNGDEERLGSCRRSCCRTPPDALESILRPQRHFPLPLPPANVLGTPDRSENTLCSKASGRLRE